MLEIQLDKKVAEDTNELEQNNLNDNNIVEPQTVDNTTVPQDASDAPPEPNCLALTVRKDYGLTVIKNVFTTSGRISLKIALSTLVLNFLKILF